MLDYVKSLQSLKEIKINSSLVIKRCNSKFQYLINMKATFLLMRSLFLLPTSIYIANGGKILLI